jgi:deoxycytidine triphosphate deaminase
MNDEFLGLKATRILTYKELRIGVENSKLLRSNDSKDSVADKSIKNPKVELNSERHVKRASLDLTIGEIYIPEKKEDERGGFNKPRFELSLNQGETALIKTAEALVLSLQRVGLASIPASLATKGALATNPGMIDPGWDDNLHVTIINMSNEPLLLKRGDRVLRVMVFDVGYDIDGEYSGTPTNMKDVIGVLSADFMDFSGRIKKEVALQEVKGKWLQAIFPVVAAVIGAFVAYAATVKNTNDRIDQLNGKIVELQAQSS